MASLQDALDKLDEAIAQLKLIKQSTDAVTKSIVNDLAPRIDDTNDLLDFEVKQNTTIICSLEKISKQTCALVNEAVEQTAAQKAIAANTTALKQLYELSNPEAGVEQRRLDELKAEVEKCCPPPKHEHPCKYEPCKDPGTPPKRDRKKDKGKQVPR